MAFSIEQIQICMVTERKASCETQETILSSRKMALTAESTNLSRQYQAKLRSKDIAYYANGQYNKMSYGYLMGYGSSTPYMIQNNPDSLKKDNSMILTDASGRVVMSNQYASYLKKVLGNDCVKFGKGGTFSEDKIPAIIAEICSPSISEEDIADYINKNELSNRKTWDGGASVVKTASLDVVETGKTHDNTDKYTEIIQSVVEFFYPMFQAAANNGWTTQYSNQIERNPDYISDALVTGSLQLQQVQCDGTYVPDASLSYFKMSGLVSERSDSGAREEITAWYNQQKDLITQKENAYDMEITELDAQIQAYNTQLESLKSLLQDDMKIFNWCNA